MRDANFQFGRTILDLCGGTGAWSQPYADAGYDVRVITQPDQDVRLWHPIGNVWGILAAPPCTELAGSGARWWAAKGEGALLKGLAVVDACLRIVIAEDPHWWVLEQPVGRASRYLGPPQMTFQPCDYGDPYTKRTCLWGDFKIPERTPVPATEGSKIHRMAPSPERAALRSITPAGFARAFFEANP
jgi:hypothetical protein